MGVVALGIILLIVVIDVILRATFSITIPGTIYIIGLSLIIVFFCSYAHSELKKEHIQVDVLVKKLPLTAEKIISTNGYFISIGVAIAISYQMFVQALFYYRGNIVTAMLDIPLWIFIMIAGLFFIPFSIALFTSFLEHFDELLNTLRAKAYLYILPGFLLAMGLFSLLLWPNLIVFDISKGTWGLILFLLLFVLIFLNVHIAVTMVIVSLVGFGYLANTQASLANVSMSFISVANQYTWSVVPLFLWMGALAFHAGFAKEIYQAARTWFSRLPGGLASASVGACGVLAAITGSSLTGVLTMGVLGLPEMRKYKYDMKLATGCICAGSTIGILIPPSVGFIIYGLLTEESIGQLFMAGLFPGILFTTMLIVMITLMCRRNPNLGPPGPSTSWGEKMKSFKDVWAVLLLIFLVLGGIYSGIFTPTEAGAMGSFGAIVIGFARKKLSFKGLLESAVEAVRLSGVILFIFVSAIALGNLIAGTRLNCDLVEWIIGLGLSKYAIIAAILFIYMILGCIMNSIPAIILTLPLFFPIVVAAGWDPILFGVLIVVMIEIGLITPPIGMNVFAMSAIAKDVPMYSIFRGILPFWAAFIVLIIILIAFPQISLWLPNTMFGS